MPVIQPFLRLQKVVRVPPRSSRRKAPPVVEETVVEETVVEEALSEPEVEIPVEAAPPQMEEVAPTVEVEEVSAPVIVDVPNPLATLLEGNSGDVQEAIATGAYDANIGELHALEEAGKKRKKVLAALEARIA